MSAALKPGVSFKNYSCSSQCQNWPNHNKADVIRHRLQCGVVLFETRQQIWWHYVKSDLQFSSV